MIKKSASGKLNTIRMKISYDDLKNTLLPLPPTEEQKLISKYLAKKTTQINTYIKKLKKEIELLKEYRQKVISQAVTCGLDEDGNLRERPDSLPAQGWKDSGVEWLGAIPEGWEVRKLKYVAKINPESLSENTSQEYELEYVDIGSVDRAKGMVKTEKFLFKDAPSRARRTVEHGDIIVSTVRTYLKAISAINNPKENLIVSTGFAVLRPRNGGVESAFFKYSLFGDYFINNVVRNSEGVNYPAINSTKLGSIPILIPSVEEQQRIIKKLDRNTSFIDRQVAEIQQQIEYMKEYKQSLISKVVTGKVDVRNVSVN
jgi:type I restriction enzyme S subunit